MFSFEHIFPNRANLRSKAFHKSSKAFKAWLIFCRLNIFEFILKATNGNDKSFHKMKYKIFIFEKLESQEVGRNSLHAHQLTQHPHKTQQKIHADSVHTIQKLHNCFPRAVYYCATFFHFQKSSLRLALPIVMHRRELSPLLDEFNVCLSTGCLSRVCGVCACISTRLSVS